MCNMGNSNRERKKTTIHLQEIQMGTIQVHRTQAHLQHLEEASKQVSQIPQDLQVQAMEASQRSMQGT